MEQANQIDGLLQYHFKYHQGFYDRSAIKELTQLLKIGVVTEDAQKRIQLNFSSDLLNQAALNIAGKMLSKNMPEDIDGAFQYLDEFEKSLKFEYGIENYQSVYSDHVKALKAHALSTLNKGVSTYAFLIEFLEKESEKRKHLRDFLEIYFLFLRRSNYGEETIYNSCVAVFNTKSKNAYHMYKYLVGVATYDIKMAYKIYGYGIKNQIISYAGFAPNLLIGIHNYGDEKAIQLAEELFGKDEVEGLKALCGFKLNSDAEIDKVFKFIENASAETVPLADLKSKLLCNIIENENTPKTTEEECVRKILNLLRSENHELAHAVFNNITYVEGHEYERYIMLHSYLSNTKNIRVLDDFFYHFKDPKYLFDLLVRNYETHGFRGSIDKFEQGIFHFWNEDSVKTESQILDLFKHQNLGLLAVKIMLSGSGYPLPVDLHKLDTEVFQIYAIDSMCNYPHSIDKLIFTILKFRFSRFEAVKKHLQNRLADLIFDTYHKSLYNLIENELDIVTDRKFLAPLKKALTEYEKMKTFKNMKTLDPMENERNLMDLYYRLEHENQAKLMNDTKGRGQLSAMFKNIEIVRGKAWKLDGKEEVYPMQLIETSMMIDSKAYKNPIGYEQNLENL